MSYIGVQETYMLAKAHLEALEQQERDVEQKYIREHGIVNDDGSIPRASWAIDNDEICEKAMADCSKLALGSGLWAELVEARKLLELAENDLLAYGLSLVPKAERDILSKAVIDNFTVRKKVVDLTMKLDARTVKAN